MDLGPYCHGTLSYQPSIYYKHGKCSEEKEDEKKKKNSQFHPKRNLPFPNS